MCYGYEYVINGMLIFKWTAGKMIIESRKNDHHISSIRVNSLFGRYSYSLPAKDEEISDLSIIYGENGVGKTTLLSLVFHLLSPSNKRGHRTKIAEIPFSTLTVILADGTILSATKDIQLLTGPVVFSIEKPRRKKIQWRFVPGSGEPSFDIDNIHPDIDIKKIPLDIRKNIEYAIEKRDFFKEMDKLRVNTFMLTSDRLFFADSISDEMKNVEYKPRQKISDIVFENRINAINEALKNASNWLQRKFIQRSYNSQSNSDPYQEVVKKIASTTYRTRAGLNKSQETRVIASLKTAILELDAKAKEFSELGLGSFSVPIDLIAPIESSGGNKLNLINSILEPHLNGLKAKFDNLSQIYKITDKFIKNINRFFRDKELIFSIQFGFKIVVDKNSPILQEIAVSQLSSGEQQLLLLFCHVLVAQDEPSIFIIDEPEISLNVVWQRILVSSLQSLAKDADIQFIFASHSLEILAKHRNRVISMQEQ